MKLSEVTGGDNPIPKRMKLSQVMDAAPPADDGSEARARGVAKAVGGKVDRIASGVTFRLSDLVQDLGIKGENAVRSATGTKLPFTSAQFRDARAAERKKDKAAPIEDIAGSVVSPLGEAITPLKAAGRPLLRAILGGASGGALTGGSEAVQNGQGGVVDRAVQVAKGAGLGGAEGAAGGAALHGAGKLAGTAGRGLDAITGYKLGDALSGALRKVSTALGGETKPPGPTGAERAALSRVRQHLAMERPEDRDVSKRVAEYEPAGVSHPTFGEVAGHNTNAVFRNANSKLGEGRSEAIDYRKKVRGNAVSSAQERSSALSPAEHRGKAVSEVKEELKERQDNLAKDQFREPYAHPIQADDRLMEILNFDEGKKAFSEAMKTAKARSMTDPEAEGHVQQLASLKKYAADRDAYHEALRDHYATKPEGTYEQEPPADAREILNNPSAPDHLKQSVRQAYGHKPAEPPVAPTPPQISAGAVDRLRISLRDKGRSLFDQNRKALGGGVGDRAELLDGYLDSVPHLKEARETYHGLQRQMDALDFKGSIFGPHAEFAAKLKKLKPEQIAPLRKLAEQEITADMGASTRGALAKEDVFSTGTDASKNLKALFGDEEGDKFITAMRLLQNRSQQANFVAPDTGSQTQPRASEGAQLGRAGLMALFGHHMPAIRHALTTLMNPSMSEAEARELTRLGLSPAKDVLPKLGEPTPPTARPVPAAAAGSALAQALSAQP